MAKRRFKCFFAMLHCLVIIITFLSGCTYNLKYRGKYPNLYTVAINSILWNAGYSQGADFAQQPKIEILEIDDYGRTLFTYFESKKAQYNLVISQYSEEDYVYYYEDFNFLTKEITNPIEEFSKEDLNHLKILNDWGKEIDLEKCIKKQITNVKPSIPCDNKIIEEKVVQKFNADRKSCFTDFRYLTSDKLDNFIVYGYINLYDDDMITYFVVFIDADCEEFNFFIPADLYAYQEEFKNFKVQNGWESK